VEIVLVRHALPLRVELESGIADPELGAEGHEQAAKMAAYLGTEDIEAIFVSPLRRAIETARPDTGIDLLMGIGGTPEGVITAVAMICLGGAIQGQLHKDGITDPHVLTTSDLCNSEDVFLSATGITDGEIVQGIRHTKFGATSHSLVMRGKSKTVRLIRTEHNL
jgi:fructose-1,6-bisphosphatase II